MSDPTPPKCIFCHLNHERYCVKDGSFSNKRLAREWLKQMISQAPAPDPSLPKEEDWAYNCLDELLDRRPKQGFIVILEAASMLATNQAASYLAAGPLEQVIADRGETVIDAIEAIAERSARFRFLLTGVWPQGKEASDVWQRVLRARELGPWMDYADLPDNDLQF